MSFDCRKCEDYAHCTEPCQDVRQYIGQDHVKRSRKEICTEVDRELINSDYKVYIYTRMKQIERIKEITTEHKEILRMRIAKVRIKDIAIHFTLSERRIKQIIRYYKGK